VPAPIKRRQNIGIPVSCACFVDHSNFHIIVSIRYFNLPMKCHFSHLYGNTKSALHRNDFASAK
jgi:hypothetical protein